MEELVSLHLKVVRGRRVIHNDELELELLLLRGEETGALVGSVS